MEAFNFLFIEKTHYSDALRLQETLHQASISSKAIDGKTRNYLVFLQHNPVYTLGKSGDESHLKVPVEECGAEFFKTSRGGDITFHGPGQLVGYPIFDLASFKIGVRDYVDLIEECVIQLCSNYGVTTGRLAGASGVWVDAEGENPRKICAVGIKISRGVSMHGFAFNINTDLSYFENIVPCGIEDKGVTSLSKECGINQTVEKVIPEMLQIFQQKFTNKYIAEEEELTVDQNFI